GFGGADSVEIRLPRLREILTRLLSVQTIGLLDKRSLLKVLTLGNANLIERLRNEAIAMVAALQGGDGRAGLIGGIRNDIHNRPSPQQLALVKAYRAWLALGCSDPAARQKIVDLGYEVDQSDVIGDAVARQRVIGACDRLINTLEEVYGEGNARTLRTEHTAWRRALVDREAEKAAVAAALECAGKERPT
ncbi:MAG: hypothetical protein NTZ95_03480, partial [Candidatus Omnitrophica bacterium]|nr:hypothetical protein [Candidatus Omnitrophota bacterium]